MTTEITREQAKSLLDYMNNQGARLSDSGFPFLNDSGRYYLRDGNIYVALDYSYDTEGFVEEFKRLEDCLIWLGEKNPDPPKDAMTYLDNNFALDDAAYRLLQNIFEYSKTVPEDKRFEVLWALLDNTIGITESEVRMFL